MNTEEFSRKKEVLRPKVSKGRPESPLVGQWGKAPYPKMLRYLFLEMFGLSLTALFYPLGIVRFARVRLVFAAGA